MTAGTTLLVRGKGERTRARLLEIAVRRFSAEGYRRTSVSDVARDAGLTPAAVYAYFSGKEALFEAAVDFDAAGLIDAARDAIPAATSARERLLVLIGELIERLDAHPLARRVLAGGEPEVIRRLLDLPSLRALVVETTELLQRAQERGEVRRDVDPTLVSWGLETIVLTLLMGHLQAGVDPGSDRALGALTVLDAALRPPT